MSSSVTSIYILLSGFWVFYSSCFLLCKHLLHPLPGILIHPWISVTLVEDRFPYLIHSFIAVLYLEIKAYIFPLQVVLKTVSTCDLCCFSFLFRRIIYLNGSFVACFRDFLTFTLISHIFSVVVSFSLCSCFCNYQTNNLAFTTILYIYLHRGLYLVSIVVGVVPEFDNCFVQRFWPTWKGSLF